MPLLLSLLTLLFSLYVPLSLSFFVIHCPSPSLLLSPVLLFFFYFLSPFASSFYFSLSFSPASLQTQQYAQALTCPMATILSVRTLLIGGCRTLSWMSPATLATDSLMAQPKAQFTVILPACGLQCHLSVKVSKK